jgi:hypothetical protein
VLVAVGVGISNFKVAPNCSWHAFLKSENLPKMKGINYSKKCPSANGHVRDIFIAQKRFSDEQCFLSSVNVVPP